MIGAVSQHDYSLTDAWHAPTSNLTPPDEARLLVFAGPMEGVAFGLARGTSTLGRREACEIRLPLTGVSKAHCRFEVRAEGRTVVEDLGSKNGSLLNGRRLEPDQPVLLCHGDILVVAATSMFFLNPRKDTTEAYEGSVAIDFGKAAEEADDFLTGMQDLLAECRARRSAR
jgi:pSer/pThr/pTyr-binding forkhead associated (FHA) protein